MKERLSEQIKTKNLLSKENYQLREENNALKAKASGKGETEDNIEKLENELAKWQTDLKKVKDDNEQLRDQVRGLEDENRQLRSEVQKFEDYGQPLMKKDNGDSKEEDA